MTENGQPNTTKITASQYYGALLAEDFLYDASFIKLKELSLGYSFPSKMLKKTPLTSLNVSFVARNLCYLLKHTPGTSPEVVTIQLCSHRLLIMRLYLILVPLVCLLV